MQLQQSMGTLQNNGMMFPPGANFNNSYLGGGMGGMGTPGMGMGGMDFSALMNNNNIAPNPGLFMLHCCIFHVKIFVFK